MPNINDGKGLWDNEGICDKAILICNDALKQLFSGEYIEFCNKLYQVAHILVNIKTGVKEERKSYEERIEELKAANNRLVEQVAGLPAITDEKGGAE